MGKPRQGAVPAFEPASLLSAVAACELLPVFDHLPEVHLFVKDRQGRFLHINRAVAERLHLKDPSEMLGTTDHDRYPQHMADRFVATDQEVMNSGQPLLNHPEILYEETGALVWFRTSKFPLRDHLGAIVGIVGITVMQPSGEAGALADGSVEKAIALIGGSKSGVRVVVLAKEIGVSVRNLNREFRRKLGMSAQEFLLRNRIQKVAAALRESEVSLAGIAADYGFYDQSAFTRQFRQRVGLTPRAYRKLAG